MTETQKHLLKLALEIDTICREHDIQYFLEFGTALGGLRHRGFIPWDNDLDLVMNEENYDRFKKACQETLDHTTRTFVDNRLDRDHPSVFGHYIDMESYRISGQVDFWNNHCGQRIDVFCMLELPGDPEKMQEVKDRFFAYDEFVNRSFPHYLRKTPRIYELYQSYLKRAEEIGFEETCQEIEREVFGQHYEDCEYYLMGSARFGNTPPIVPKRSYETVHMCEFEGHPLPLPGGLVDNLILYYGDDFSQFPKDLRIHSEMSHTGIPSKSYVEEYRSVVDLEQVLSHRFEYKKLGVENGYQLNEIKSQFLRLQAAKSLDELQDRIQEYHADLDELISAGAEGVDLLNKLFQPYLKKQLHSTMRYWRIHFGASARMDYAAMHTMLMGMANYSGIDRLITLRKECGLAITDDMKRIQCAVDHLRGIRKNIIYRDWDAARNDLTWCQKHCPDAKNLTLWEVRLNLCTAESEDEILVCRRLFDALEGYESDDQYYCKAKADLFWLERDYASAKEIYSKLKESSNDGLILMDIADREAEAAQESK